jgi:peroxiredoxin
MLPLGTPAPDFRLLDTTGKLVTLDDFRGRPALLVMFICNHCPFVKHVAAELASLGKDYLPKGVGIVAINSNDADAYPEDSPAKMREEKLARGYEFPYLYDESQAVAAAYHAACTPDFYLFDGKLTLAYRGQLDASRPGNDVPVTGQDLRAALDAVLAGRRPAAEQRPSIGCNVKWRGGRQPF